VRRALEEPLRQIVRTAGVEGAVVVDEVKTASGDRGFDAKESRMTSMYEAGIVDPTKVVRTALQNAASIAGLMLTTETLITDLKDEKKVAAGAQT
jgi:chaperonin GroEL